MNRCRTPLLLLLIVFTSGCAFYRHRDVILTIHDEGTNSPAEGIAVETFYGHGGLFNPPRRASAVTDRGGQAKLRMADPTRCSQLTLRLL